MYSRDPSAVKIILTLFSLCCLQPFIKNPTHVQSSSHNEGDGHSVFTMCHTIPHPPFYIFKTFHSLTFALVTLQLPCRLLTHTTTAPKLPPQSVSLHLPLPSPSPLSTTTTPHPSKMTASSPAWVLLSSIPLGSTQRRVGCGGLCGRGDRARGKKVIKKVEGEKLASAKPVGVVEGEKVE
jgi:hypothetical protein